MRLQVLLVASAMLVFAQSPADSAANHCDELKPLAAKVRVQNEFVQERSFRSVDSEWCSHARAMTQAMDDMLQIIQVDSNRCRNSEAKVEALQKAAHRTAQLSEGCP